MCTACVLRQGGPRRCSRTSTGAYGRTLLHQGVRTMRNTVLSLSTSTVLVPAVSLVERLADADARTTDPALAGMAALTPAAVESAEREAVRRSVDAQFPAVAAFLADEPARQLDEPEG